MNVNNRTLLIAGAVVVVGSAFILYQLTKNKEEATNTTQQESKNGSEPDDQKQSLSGQDDFLSTVESNNSAYINRFPVQVFVRIRPLIKEEIESKHDEMSWVTRPVKNNKQLTTLVLKKAFLTKKKGKLKKSFDGFQTVLKPSENNNITFNKTILPNLKSFFNGNVVCSFAYGHTGSGKSHTMLGYPAKNVPGMYELTAIEIFKELNIINNKNNLKLNDNEIYLEIRFSELYNGKMRDLFSDKLVECFIRESRDGEIHIRGPTIKDDKTGQVTIQPLTPKHAKSADDVITFVNKAKEARNVGSSTVHDESSRSHAFLEFELVTNKIVNARNKLLIAEAELVPHGKARDDEMMFIQGSMFKQDLETGKWSQDDNWQNPDPDKIVKLEETVKIYEGKVDDAEKAVKKAIEDMKKIHRCVSAEVIFVDLAGNEWGQDSKIRTGKGRDTPQQARERKEINKSLLSLKECIRGLHSDKDHIPFRNSKLTMVLRPHLKGDNSTAIMIANVSSSQNDIAKTVNTLQYSALVAQA